MHAYSQLTPNGLDKAARSVGESILAEYVREHAPRRIQLTEKTRRELIAFDDVRANGGRFTSPMALLSPSSVAPPVKWTPSLFANAESELSARLRTEYMPMFMQHAVFDFVLRLLGAYDADNLFPPETLSTVKEDLINSMEGELRGTQTLGDLSV